MLYTVAEFGVDAVGPSRTHEGAILDLLPPILCMGFQGVNNCVKGWGFQSYHRGCLDQKLLSFSLWMLAGGCHWATQVDLVVPRDMTWYTASRSCRIDKQLSGFFDHVSCLVLGGFGRMPAPSTPTSSSNIVVSSRGLIRRGLVGQVRPFFAKGLYTVRSWRG